MTALPVERSAVAASNARRGEAAIVAFPGRQRGRRTLVGTIAVTGSCTQAKRGMLRVLEGYASGLSNTVRYEGQRA